MPNKYGLELTTVPKDLYYHEVTYVKALERVRVLAERICKKLESPTASVTIIDQPELRNALDAVNR